MNRQIQKILIAAILGGSMILTSTVTAFADGAGVFDNTPSDQSDIGGRVDRMNAGSNRHQKVWSHDNKTTPADADSLDIIFSAKINDGEQYQMGIQIGEPMMNNNSSVSAAGMQGQTGETADVSQQSNNEGPLTAHFQKDADGGTVYFEKRSDGSIVYFEQNPEGATLYLEQQTGRNGMTRIHSAMNNGDTSPAGAADAKNSGGGSVAAAATPNAFAGGALGATDALGTTGTAGGTGVPGITGTAGTIEGTPGTIEGTPGITGTAGTIEGTPGITGTTGAIGGTPEISGTIGGATGAPGAIGTPNVSGF